MQDAVSRTLGCADGDGGRKKCDGRAGQILEVAQLARRVSRRVRIVLFTVAALVVAIQLVPVDRGRPLADVVVPAPERVIAVLRRACSDGNSKLSRWDGARTE